MDEHSDPAEHLSFPPLDGMKALYSSNGSAEPTDDEIPAATHWPSIPVSDANDEWGELRAWVLELKARFDSVDHQIGRASCRERV